MGATTAPTENAGPFALNPKCILFSLVCMALFLYRPSFSHPAVAFFALAVVFWAAYISMAWYDYYFNCDVVPLRKGQYSLQGLFKPPAHAPTKQYLPVGVPQGVRDAHRDRTLIYLLHAVVIAPFIAYISYMGRRTPAAAYWLLAATAALTFTYHGLGLFTLATT